MYSTLFDDPKNQLLVNRLNRVADELRQLPLSTKEEYQVELYSRVNRILAEAGMMRSLLPVVAASPAAVGDVADNLRLLNEDGADIAERILRTEDIAARLFNLAASSQNSLRQQIRERLLGSDPRCFREDFIHDRQLFDYTAELDFNAGLATLPLEEETELFPSIAVGDASSGEIVLGVENLSDDRVETALAWLGDKLELVLTFPQAQIVNRLRLEMDDYEGLEITSLSSTPDGTTVEDVLSDLGVRSLQLNAAQSKYSGDFILDFTPRHVLNMRLIIEDRVGESNIALRSLKMFRRKYSSAGSLVTSKISAPTGAVTFEVEQQVKTPFTAIAHFISYNGNHFQAIQPGPITLVSSPFYYRAVMERNDSRFSDELSPLIQKNADPIADANYSLSSSHLVPLGDGVVERTLNFSTISGPVEFRETPLLGTLAVQQGALLLTPNMYAFSNNILSFSGPQTGITVTYQTSSLGLAALGQRQPYYSPLLYSVRFKKV